MIPNGNIYTSNGTLPSYATLALNNYIVNETSTEFNLVMTPVVS